MESEERGWTGTGATRAFAVPERLEDLVGPGSGRLRLPDSVHWGPESSVDLAYWDDVAKAYEATLREGDLREVHTIVNPTLLRRWWSQLFLPARIRQAWESRFPELTA